jgi:hypothetical protein
MYILSFSVIIVLEISPHPYKICGTATYMETAGLCKDVRNS